MTWSTLKLVPTDEDDQSVISCVASNIYFPIDSKEHQIILNVHCTVLIIIYVCTIFHCFFFYFYSDPPRLQISLGRNLNASNIKEGSDVYFECNIKASPRIIRLEWEHNVSMKIYFNFKFLL